MKNELIGHCLGIGEPLRGHIGHAAGAFFGPAVRLKPVEAESLTAVAPRGSGGQPAPIVPLMTTTKQSAYKQLNDRAEQLRRQNSTAPWLVAIKERPDLAAIAEGQEPPPPLKASASPTTKDAAGAALVRLVGELSARSGRSRGDCWMQVLRENAALALIAEGR
jgi:hypothetical protein